MRSPISPSWQRKDTATAQRRTRSCRATSASSRGSKARRFSAVGLPRTVVLPGDSLSLERFIVTAPGPGLGKAADLALEAREQMFAEQTVVVSGHVTAAGDKPLFGNERTASLLFYSPASTAAPTIQPPARR